MPIENLQSIIRCPVCNKKYRPAKMMMIDEDERRTTFHLSCTDCGASSMIFVSMGQFGIVSLGVLTDLKQSEAQKVFFDTVVSSNQVIEVYQFLKQHSGGVEALL